MWRGDERRRGTKDEVEPRRERTHLHVCARRLKGDGRGEKKREKKGGRERGRREYEGGQERGKEKRERRENTNKNARARQRWVAGPGKWNCGAAKSTQCSVNHKTNES